jgi:ribonuclease P protein component
MPPDVGSGKRQRFLKKNRLRKRREFLWVQKRGRRIQLQDLLAIILPRMPGGLRLGITASRKVGGAVQRNRCKRLIREAWRQDSLQLPRGYDVVLIAKRGASRATLHSIRRQIRKLGQKMTEDGKR